MEDDFLREMGYPGLTSRLKRLSDMFLYGTKEFYKKHDLEIEPNWILIFWLLKKYNKLTVTQISERLYLSHPAIVLLINKMKKKGFIDSLKDKDDKRKVHLTLSQKALDQMPMIEKFYKAGNKAVQEVMSNDPAVLEQLKVLEDNLEKEDFFTRVNKNFVE